MLNFLLSQFEGGHGGAQEVIQQPTKQQQQVNDQEDPYPDGSQ